MANRRNDRWRALAVGLVTFAAVVWPSVATATSLLNPTLVRQSSVVTLNKDGSGQLTVVMATGGSNGDHDDADLSVYPMIHTRSDLTPIIDGVGAQGLPISSTDSFRLDCRVNGNATINVTVSEHAGPAAKSCGATPQLVLNCRALACSGVYPLGITTSNGPDTVTIWSLLSVSATTVTSPVGVSWILDSNPVNATVTTRETNALRTLARFPNATFTIGVNYQGISRVFFSSTAKAASYRHELGVTLAPTRHGLIDATPSSINFAALTEHHIAGDVVNQTRLATNLVDQFTSKPRGQALALTGATSPADLTSLGTAHVHEVVLPDDALQAPLSSSLFWGTPFRLYNTPRSLVAVSTDTPLAALAEDGSIAPGLRATLTLGELALLHFEQPYATTMRTAVVDVPLGDVGSTYLSTLFNGLRDDSLVHTAALGSLFKTSSIGANNYPSYQALAANHVASWSLENAKSASMIDLDLQSFGQSITSLSPTTGIEVQVLDAERTQRAANRQLELNRARDNLQNALSDFHIDDTTITLAGSGATLPLTMTSTANYTISGWLSLSAPNVSFPEANPVHITLSSSTGTVRVPAYIHGPGNFTLVVQFLSNDRRLVIADGAIQVRTTTSSTVGYLLTGGAVFVIALWWWRTTRRRTKGRHAR